MAAGAQKPVDHRAKRFVDYLPLRGADLLQQFAMSGRQLTPRQTHGPVRPPQIRLGQPRPALRVAWIGFGHRRRIITTINQRLTGTTTERPNLCSAQRLSQLTPTGPVIDLATILSEESP
jgi:hypothetical protein